MTATFTRDTMTMDGKTYPASYCILPSSNPHADGSVFVYVSVGTQQIRLKVEPTDPHHAAALAAAMGQQEQPQEAQPQQEQPADVQPQEQERDSKQARGPVPEKSWIGSSIQGNGWKIEFCPVFERTRLIFDRIPTKEAREMVKAAGFAWSPKMGSWNKGLTWKAYRAAQKLAADLGTLTRRAC